MCGIFGISNHDEASKMAYLGLYALQHRGQEACGIVSANGGGKLHRHAGSGLVAEVFNKSNLSKLKGNTAIGHVRYSTSGGSGLSNAQPFTIRHSGRGIALAHNGNLCNAGAIRKKLEKEGSIFNACSDTEVILHLIAKSGEKTIEGKIIEALSLVKGAYSLLFIVDGKMIAARDPHGIRPLAAGRLGDSYVAASETCAFDLIGAEYESEIEPGSLVIFENGKRKKIGFDISRKRAYCVFELIYFARPDSKVFGLPVYEVRESFGRTLAEESIRKTGIGPKNADMVVPVPDSSNVAALGFAGRAGLPFEFGLIRNHYIGRTFIEPDSKIRDFGAKIKYNPVGYLIRDKSVILVDDSIVRGTTGRKLIRILRNAGVKKIHKRVSSPPVRYPCFYGIDTPEKKQLIASLKSPDEIRKLLGADSLYYLSIDGMFRLPALCREDFCTACFDGKYPHRKGGAVS